MWDKDVADRIQYIIHNITLIIMSNTIKYPTIAFGRRKRIDITKFRGVVYIHLHDMQKGKSITLQKDEYDVLVELRNKINKKVEKVLKLSKEQTENDKDRKNKKKARQQDKKEIIRRKESESSSDTGTEDSSDSDV